MTSFLRSDRSRPVAIWLFVVAALVFCMVVVGGATRLTDSGLSITEWKPIMGALPPMSEAAWRANFELYKEIPQYRLVNAGMTLEAYKTIFWWEWGHRLLGRLVGAVFAIPFVFFLIRQMIPRRLIWRCAVMLLLGGLQGLVGWWMVSSGLSERVSVAPERLMTHLGLALALFVMLIWTALDAWAGSPRVEERSPWRGWALALLGAIFFQSLLGALVAGNDAGLVYNDWPLMNGAVVPPVDNPSSGVASALPQTALEQLATWTGGQLFVSSAPSHASQAARTIITDLRQQYLLAFTADTRPGWHRLTVRTRQHQNTVRTRAGYVTR